jgi:hypothetical protein
LPSFLKKVVEFQAQYDEVRFIKTIEFEGVAHHINNYQQQQKQLNPKNLRQIETNHDS